MNARSRPRAAATRSLLPAIAVGVMLAGGVHAQSLEDALASAYNTNFQLQAERAQQRAVDEKVPQALANWRPIVTVVGNANITHNTLNKDNSPAIRDNTLGLGILRSVGYGITITQPVFRGFRTAAQSAQAENLVQAEVAHLTSIEESVLLAAITDYFDIYRDQIEVDINLDFEAFMGRLVETARARYQQNNVAALDVSQAQAGLAEAAASRRQAEGALESARASFLRDVGLLPGKLPPASLTVTVPLPPDRDAAVTAAVTENPDVVSALYTERAAADNVRLVRGQLLPTVSIEGLAARNVDPVFSLRRLDTEAATLNVTVPLYEEGAFYSQTREAVQADAVAQNQFDLAREQARQAAVATWEQLHANREAATSLEAEVNANESAVSAVQRLAALGQRTIQDVVFAEERLFQARVNLAQARHDESVAEFALAGIAGRLTARQLALAVDYYDPQKYYDAVHDKWFGFGPKE